MSNQHKPGVIDFSHNPYEQEARKLWGNQAVEESNSRLTRLSESERKHLAETMNGLFEKLASLRHLPAESPEAQTAIEEWYALLNEMGDLLPGNLQESGPTVCGRSSFHCKYRQVWQGLGGVHVRRNGCLC
jgi:hypothetical protein